MAGFRATNARALASLTVPQRQAGLIALELRNEMVEQLSQPGTGRTYTRGTVTHRASSPGEPPAVDTGRLRQSISVQKIGDGHYRVGTNVSYALTLEFGTQRAAPRPWIRPALAAVRSRH